MHGEVRKQSIKISGGSKMCCIMLDGGGQGRAPIKLPSPEEIRTAKPKHSTEQEKGFQRKYLPMSLQLN